MPDNLILRFRREIEKGQRSGLLRRFALLKHTYGFGRAHSGGVDRRRGEGLKRDDLEPF
jgi:hypothetical protein